MRFSGDILASVPSIVIGIFAYALFVKGRGFSAYAGGLALAMIMIPIVARTTEELLDIAHTDAAAVLAKDPHLDSERGQALRTLLYLFNKDAAVPLLRAG